MFSNLMTLKYFGFDGDGFRWAKPAQLDARQPQFQFPKLRGLEYISYFKRNVVFSPQVASTHLDVLDIIMDITTFYEFNFWLINPVGTLDLSLGVCDVK